MGWDGREEEAVKGGKEGERSKEGRRRGREGDEYTMRKSRII